MKKSAVFARFLDKSLQLLVTSNRPESGCYLKKSFPAIRIVLIRFEPRTQNLTTYNSCARSGRLLENLYQATQLSKILRMIYLMDDLET